MFRINLALISKKSGSYFNAVGELRLSAAVHEIQQFVRIKCLLFKEL